MNFQFHTPIRLIVGCGTCKNAGTLASEIGKRGFVIFNASSEINGNLERLLESLADRQIQAFTHRKPPGEPDVDMVNAATEMAIREKCDFVLSLGGGSAIDLAKAVAGLATNGGNIIEYLEGVGSGRSVDHPALPHIAIPTTAGAGAEVTRNAVIRSPEGRFKKSFRSPYLYPAIAILDAELTVSLPPEQTAFSGMDAVTQLIESYLTRKANPITDALALHGMELAFRAIRNVYHNGADLQAREEMLLASTLSGICLANAGLGMAHGFASGLGALYDIPHGKACAILLPHMMRYNVHAALEKMARIGYILHDSPVGSEENLAGFAIQQIEKLNEEFGIPADLKSLDIPPSEYDLLIEMSMGNSMSGNPLEITLDKARVILEHIA
jgi:alcohol dehydrogenase class IV